MLRASTARRLKTVGEGGAAQVGVRGFELADAQRDFVGVEAERDVEREAAEPGVPVGVGERRGEAGDDAVEVGDGFARELGITDGVVGAAGAQFFFDAQGVERFAGGFEDVEVLGELGEHVAVFHELPGVGGPAGDAQRADVGQLVAEHVGGA